MKTGAMSRLSAAIIVLVMALSAMVALPMKSANAADGTNDISVLVVDETNYATVGTATVNLINLYTGEVIGTEFSGGLYVASEPSPGVYRVEVTAADYRDKIDAFPDGLSFDGLKPYYADVVELAPLPPRVYTWNVTVENALGPVSGVTVGFYDDNSHEVVGVGAVKTNSEGWTLVDMYHVTTSGIYLFASKSGYETYVDPITVTSSETPTITLTSAKIVRGVVRDMEGYRATNTVAYLVDHDTSVPWIKRVLKSVDAGNSYEIYAHYGTFTLCVDAYGLRSQFLDVTLDSGNPYSYTSMQLEDQTKRVETTSIVYGSDFNAFEMDVSTVWSYDDTVPGLPYSDVGSLRMQIDLLDPTTTDGTVDSTEAAMFAERMDAYGPEYVSTKELLTVNGTAYLRSSTWLSSVGSVAGSVDLDTGVSFGYSASYASKEAIDVGATGYYADAYVKYDDPSVDHVYTIALPAAYEMVANSTGNTDSRVNSTGFTTVTLDPEEYLGGPEHVTMSIEMSERPTASAKVEVDSEHAYAVTNETGAVLSYIVAVNQEVNFSASGSADPNENPLMYTWNFGDGMPAKVTFNETIPYTYLTAAATRTVNLTVTDMGGLVNWTEITVMCDGKDPVPVITVKDLVVNGTSGMLEIDQGELVWFNATNSSDDAVSVGDGLGTVQFVEFFYGEGNTSGRVYAIDDEQNVSYSWADSGVYTLTLNVTDSVGHWKNTTMTVRVNDTESPVPSYVVKNETWGTSLIENKTLVFDANATSDNLDNKTTLHFSWYFNDNKGADSWLNGTGLWNVTHMFEKAGTYAVRLNVTDSEGNWDGYTKSVIVVSGPRPSVVIDAVTFEPDVFTEGQTGYIIVNLTNRGSADATQIVLKFAIEKADGTEEFLGQWTVILNRTTEEQVSVVGVSSTAVAKFPYKFSDPGTFKIKVNVTSANQLAVDEDVDTVTVDEAGWKRVALWGGVAAVIILVPLLLYLRGRWSRRERKGPRREKQEKADRKLERAAEKAERAERAEKEKLEKPRKDEDL